MLVMEVPGSTVLGRTVLGRRERWVLRRKEGPGGDVASLDMGCVYIATTVPGH